MLRFLFSAIFAFISVLSYAQFSADSVQFWVGSGSNESIIVIDFLGSEPTSYAWGVRYDGLFTGAEALDVIAAADPEFTVNQSAFLDDIIYGMMEGLSGMPNYWGTWSKTVDTGWESNSGTGTELTSGAWFGCSYTDFYPALEPNTPIAALQPLGAGPFAPAAGEEGSTAISFDDTDIIWWAEIMGVSPGPIHLGTNDTPASFGTANDATGVADGAVVSLGDGGSAITQFPPFGGMGVTNDIGPDFVIFENAFSDTFLELAFVEVTSDDENWVRFPSSSLTQTAVQVGAFDELDPTYIHNMAGKYRAPFGVPFDLDDVADDPNLDVFNITGIRIVDAIGSIDQDLASFDSNGNKVNEPFPTDFESGGFDLDAIGLINVFMSVEEHEIKAPVIFPNPAKSRVFIQSKENLSWRLVSSHGGLIKRGKSKAVNVSQLNAGIYILEITQGNQITRQQLIVE